MTEDPHWYRDAVIYQLHIKSFFDSNNDGIGDFAGLIEKLDYPSLNSVSNMFEYFYGESPDWIVAGMHPGSFDVPIQGLSTSQIAEIMKRHMKDPKKAAVAIAEELEHYELAEVLK